MTSYRFPIPPDAVRAWAHPSRGHVFWCAASIGADICAADGWGAIRADRGHWQIDDWPEAGPEFVERFEAIPWALFPPATAAGWRPADDERGAIAAAPPLSKLGIGAAVFRANLVRRMAMLPRCRVFVPAAWTDHLFFDFNGGRGIIANTKAANPVRVLFRKRFHFDGTPVESATSVVHFPLPNWPPADLTP